MLFSIFLALTLTPALCAAILKPVDKTEHEEKKGFFGWFNKGFTAGRDKYHSMVAGMLKTTGRWFILYAAIIFGSGYSFCPPAVFFPSGRRPGLFYHQHPIARRSNSGTDPEGA